MIVQRTTLKILAKTSIFSLIVCLAPEGFPRKSASSARIAAPRTAEMPRMSNFLKAKVFFSTYKSLRIFHLQCPFNVSETIKNSLVVHSSMRILNFRKPSITFKLRVFLVSYFQANFWENEFKYK